MLFGLVAGDRAGTLRLLHEFADSAGVGVGAVEATERPPTDPAGLYTYLGWPASECPPTGRAPAYPGLRVSRSEFFDRPLPPAAIASLVRHFATARVAGQYRALELIP